MAVPPLLKRAAKCPSDSPNSKALPDEETIQKAAEHAVYDLNGNKVKFGSLFAEQKTIIVFIRHFFCGNCQAYVQDLATVPKDALDQAGTRIVIVGCGEYNPIEGYAGFQGSIYADPSRSLYKVLGMDIENLKLTPAGERKRSYIKSSTLVTAVTSFWRGPLKNPSLIGRQGNISQLGGDFVFGPGNQCSFAYRMQHTEDHVEVADLMKAAGVTIP